MKNFQAFSLLGGLLMIIGVYFLIPVSPLTVSHTGTIDSGASFYLYDKFNVLKSGHLAGQFSESAGQPLHVYVFTDAQYTFFNSGETQPGLYSAEGPSGTFSTSIPSPGNYYLVFTHGAGLDSSTETVSFSATVDGYNPVILALGFGLLTGGAVSIVVGYHLRNKYLDKRLGPGASDVVMFDKPPPQPVSPP